MKYVQYSKHAIQHLLKAHAPKLDYRPLLAASHVFPMRANNYVVEQMVDWNNAPNDPYFRLLFPQPEMLREDDLSAIRKVMDTQEMFRASEDMQRLPERIRKHVPQAFKKDLDIIVNGIRAGLNPHPAGQKTENVPRVDGIEVEGVQHKYKETVLFFPSEAQFCHAYCSYCFRWAQFTSVGSPQQFKSSSPELLRRYIAANPQVTDVLFTGGDPMVMKTTKIRQYVEPLLEGSGTNHLDTIRFGTKSLAYWPYRFTTDDDAKELLELFERIVKKGKHLSIQAHFTLPRELETPVVREAIRLIHMTGANIRTQAPLIRGINDSAEVWTKMWRLQTNQKLIPYYMFVERDTGAKDFFSVPLAQAYEIFNAAQSKVGGTARTARGPSMSASPGKVAIDGISTIPTKNGDEKVFNLRFLQARNPDWTGKPFYAKFDPTATWLSDLKPAFGAEKFFYENEYDDIVRNSCLQSSGQVPLLGDGVTKAENELAEIVKKSPSRSTLTTGNLSFRDPGSWPTMKRFNPALAQPILPPVENVAMHSN